VSLPLGDVEPPVRIHVLGNSVGYFIRPPRERHEDGTFAEVLERELLDRGVRAIVTNASSWTLFSSEVVKRPAPLVLHYQPRILIVALGMFECQRKTLPTAVFRWLYTDTPQGGLNLRIRALIGPRIISIYKRLTPLVLDRIRMPHRVAPRRFESEMAALVALARKECGADVFLLTISPPGDRIAATLRDIRESADKFDDILRRVADDAGEGVRVIEIAPLVNEGPPDVVLPDGFHFNVEGHRRLGVMLADEVMKVLAR
jgi:lysophospholipase L1-like esterase